MPKHTEPEHTQPEHTEPEHTQPEHNGPVVRPRQQRARWGRLLDAVLPAPDENRLVPVTEVGRGALPMIQSSLADVGLSPIVSQTGTMTGESRFRVLVRARDAGLARQVIGWPSPSTTAPRHQRADRSQ